MYVYKRGFDNDRYLQLQSEHIRQRIDQFGGKLYLEFGGKLFDDFHASRVLPGFQPDSKVKMLVQLADQAEIVIAINAADIEKNKVRGDLGITYDLEILRLIDAFRDIGLYVGSVVLTRWADQAAAVAFESRLNSLGVKTYRHYPIPGYPNDVQRIVCDEGFGRNDYIQTTRPLVIVTAPGPGSGKMATCLSQLYHDHKRGIDAGYAKFETFPIWNLPLKHPVNLAYEAATADLNDVNMIDPFHLEAYGQTTVNYNRDVEIFPVLSATFREIMGSCPYKSPTDMGVNMAGNCIVDDEACREASRQEIIRRFYQATCCSRKGQDCSVELDRLHTLMSQMDLKATDRTCVTPALEAAEVSGEPAMCIQLPNGKLVVGNTSELMGCSAAALLNALKELAGIDHDVHLIAQSAIEPIQKLKVRHLGSANPRLHSDEVLIALATSANTDPLAQKALDCLGQLKNCQAHCSVILSNADSSTYKKLGLLLTTEPQYQTNKLYHR